MDLFEITAQDRAGKTKGQIIMTFGGSPLQLLGWTVTDARNARSRLTKRGCECEPDAGRCKRCLDVDDADSELADAVLEQLGADR